MSVAIGLLNDLSFAAPNEIPGEVEDPDVVVTTTKDTWARFQAIDPSKRSAMQNSIDIAGTKTAVRTFLKALEVFPYGRDPGDLVPSTLSRR